MENIGVLREVRDDDVNIMLAWRNSPSVRMNMYTQHEITLEEHLDWWSKIKHDPKQKYFMFEADEKPCGIISFNNIDLENKNSLWAFYTSQDAIKGAGSRMEFLAIDYAFRQLELHKINCEVLAHNTSVIKLHQKFGFKLEGVLRDFYKTDSGYEDIYQLGILKSEWIDIYDAMLNKVLKISARGK